MNKRTLLIVSIACAISLIGGSSVLAKSNQNRNTGEQHRDRTAKVVQELIKVSDKDKQIRQEIKNVAEEEKTESEMVKQKMDKVEKRNKLKSFLIGSDYKNLGELKSELMTTQNRLNRLHKSLEKTTSTTIKADLETQISELEAIKTKAESFVKDNESKFSLSGWLVKMF